MTLRWGVQVRQMKSLARLPDHDVNNPLTKFIIVAFSVAFTAAAAPAPWWDNFPRMIITPDLVTAQTYSANAAINDVANDPGWGLWFTYATDSGAAYTATRQ